MGQGRCVPGGLKPLVAAGDDVKITEHKYGKSVVWIQWNQDNKYSARFWVKRPAGWKLLHTTEIASDAQAGFQDRRADLRYSLQ